MDRFAELLEMLMNPGDDGPPATIYDDLSLAYTDEVSARDAKIGELEGGIAGHGDELAAKDAEIARLKSLMFDKLMATPDETNGDGDEDTPDGDDDEEETGVEALFEKE